MKVIIGVFAIVLTIFASFYAYSSLGGEELGRAHAGAETSAGLPL